MPSDPPAPPLAFRYFAAIFLVALVTIAAQILFSRLFSVTLYYHFGFAGITFAMLGLTVGALKVYTQPERYGTARAPQALAGNARGFAVNLAAATLLHVYVPALFFSEGAAEPAALRFIAVFLFMLSFVMLLKAFIQSGVCIALLLTRWPAHTGRLYACDLIGAGLGCIVVLAALKLLDPVATLLLLATALTMLAWRFLPERSTLIAMLALGLLSALQVVTTLQDAPAFRVVWAKSAWRGAPEFERWNSYSRVAITDKGLQIPISGGGFGIRPQTPIAQKSLTIDADAATVLTAFDGDLSKVAFLKKDIVNLAYSVRRPESVAVIGVGGGRDVLSALAFGAKRIQGIELNPAIIGALTGRFGEFTGHLDRQPGVSLANAEARSYLTSRGATYDLIQISLIDTWATTAAGGLTLSENKLYTVDAWNDFFDRLNERGMLSLVRWYKPGSHVGEFYRLLAIAAETLESRNSSADPRRHILAATVDGYLTVLISKSPLTAAEIARFHDACRALRFTPLLAPSLAMDDTAAAIASGRADDAFYDSLPIDVSAPTDDKPFFFYMLRPEKIFTGEMTVESDSNYNFKNNTAVVTLAGLFIVTLIASLALIVPPMTTIYRAHHVHLRDAAPHIAYFAAIGLGFMLIEISQMQRLMIFLGHPVYGLSVVLFTLLLSSGIGSYVQSKSAAARAWLTPALLLGVLAATGLLTPLIAGHLKYYDTPARVIASGLLMAPMGFFMGMMFPLGVALARRSQAGLLPWYWGINGAASVFASVFAVVLSLQVGIGATYWLGVACYGLCLLVILRGSIPLYNYKTAAINPEV